MKELLLRVKLSLKTTYILVAINAGVFLLTLLLTTFLGNESVALVVMGAEYFPGILSGEIWRLVLSGFLHANVIHLLVNMWALVSIGEIVENFYGSRKLVMTYVLTAISGSLLSVLSEFLRLIGDQSINSVSLSVGASGAIFGLIGLLIGNKFRRNTYSVSVADYVNTSQLWFFVFYNVLIGLGINVLGTSLAINNWAHIGGFLGGLVLGVALDPINTLYKTSLRDRLENILYWLCVGGVILSVVLQFLNLFII